MAFWTILLCLVLTLKYSISIEIDSLQLSKCTNTEYLVTVSNINIAMNPKVKITGSMNAQVDLTGPITALVWLYRHEWGFWIEVPCIDNFGSCTYKNLCDYGLPINETCPEYFQQNNVPCRCPIKKGTYTIPQSSKFLQVHSLLSGTYKGTIKIVQNNTLLSCYNINFDLNDSGVESNLV